MKRIVSLVLVLLMLFAFGVFAIGSTDSEDTSQGNGTVNGNTDSGNGNQGNGTVDSNNESNTKLGDYSVTIDSCRLAKSYDDKDVVIVKFTYTNVNNDESTPFYTAVDAKAYQGGIGLNEAYILKDSANYNSDNQSKAIKKGASLEVEVAFELNDSTTPIEIEVSEWLSLSDKTISKTFNLK